MKRIEDDETQALFNKALEDIPPMVLGCDLQKLYEHFFQAGRDSVEHIKRTITNLIKLDGQIYVISNDGKLFEWRSYPDLPKYKNLDNWSQFPDLPQD